MVNVPSFFSFLVPLLAEGDGAIKKANDGIDTLSKLAKAGPTVIALAVAAGALAFAIYMMRQNWKLRETQATELKKREEDAKKDADDRLKEVMVAERDRREAEKKMLREMIDRGHETTQALEGSTKAIESYKTLAETMLRRLEDLDRDFERRFTEIIRKLEARA